MKIEFEKTKIEPKTRRMEFGKIPICLGCGNAWIPHVKETRIECCEGHGFMPLKQYVEEVRGEEFIEENWSWEEKTINLMSDEMKDLMQSELVTFNGEKI